MPLDKDEKRKVIEEFAEKPGDVGSSAVQVGILSKRIEQISTHTSKMKKDAHSRRGLVRLVAKRRKLLNYMKGARPEKYAEIIKKLGLRH
ncbi:MAG: 30S ribosomal protein S15 [Candidatus Dadabacteria bacterium]|nr:30S ribosomal protein S15 [Candidatus Dadabacteria bacterium]MCY4042287.1 30S ribosomal protein S15 [Candidatus Dadabacteria bacterium]MCY4047540.1 30S ribosomal protein S15 [Candidatus Dadabacteria bacterium]